MYTPDIKYLQHKEMRYCLIQINTNQFNFTLIKNMIQLCKNTTKRIIHLEKNTE